MVSYKGKNQWPYILPCYPLMSQACSSPNVATYQHHWRTASQLSYKKSNLMRCIQECTVGFMALRTFQVLGYESNYTDMPIACGNAFDVVVKAGNGAGSW